MRAYAIKFGRKFINRTVRGPEQEPLHKATLFKVKKNATIYAKYLNRNSNNDYKVVPISMYEMPNKNIGNPKERRAKT